MTVNKSDLLKQLSKNYPNFVKKDLSKLMEIILNEIRKSLKNDQRVELRDTFMFEARKYKSKFARNPKTNEKILIPEKKIIRIKLSKKWQKNLNEKT